MSALPILENSKYLNWHDLYETDSIKRKEKPVCL